MVPGGYTRDLPQVLGREEPALAGGDQGPKALNSKERIKTFTGCGVLCQVYTGEGG